MESLEAMERKRTVWSSAGSFDIPRLPPECYNELNVDIEALKRYIERHWRPIPAAA